MDGEDVMNTVAVKPDLAEICPRCGNRMTQTIMEHVLVRTCTVDGYECKEVTGESKMAFYEAIGQFYITRNRR